MQQAKSVVPGTEQERRSRFGIAVAVCGVFMSIALLTRLGLMGLDRVPSAHGPLIIARTLAVGEVFDLTATLWLVAPLMLYLTLVTDRWLHRRWHQRLVWTLTVISVAFAVFVAAAEVVFFDEFTGRFNFVAVDYLIYPTEVVTNIWESYPLVWSLIGIALAAIAVVYAVRRRIAAALHSSSRLRQRVGGFVAYAALLAVCTFGVSPAWAHVSDDRTLNEIATNGYYSFWGAFMGQGARYDGLYATRDSRANVSRLHSLLRERGTRDLDSASVLRHVGAEGTERRLNVVVVLEESLGSQFVGVVQPPGTPTFTPRYDSLAAEGTLLTNAYSTGNRTIRALEATSTSLPPLPGISVVRRPESVNLFTLASLLRDRGYGTEFIYGGRAMFDGMGAFMRNNGMQRIIEQSDFPDTSFTTAWGVSDEAIFDRALVEMDSLHRTGKPFYALVLSVSNHKPYVYPTGRIVANPAERKRTNAVQYADYALGRFARMARTHTFFDSTLFVLMGDHGARVYGAAEIPLPSYQVPILFYGPKIIAAAARVPTLASAMDLPPTILGVLGMSYDSKFFGRDVLHIEPTDGRAVMTHNNDIALMRADRLAVLGLKGKTTLYDVDGEHGTITRVAQPDSAGRELIADAIAYFQAADELYRAGKQSLSRR
jgi:phosphoglycerol transferase MdoB-like AlkP superfamily enzyme